MTTQALHGFVGTAPQSVISGSISVRIQGRHMDSQAYDDLSDADKCFGSRIEGSASRDIFLASRGVLQSVA